jgi:hypothetical protein
MGSCISVPEFIVLMVNYPIACLPVAARLPETRRREAASQNFEPRPACGGREGVWTLLTSLTWLTSLTADIVDVIWEILGDRPRSYGACCG